MDTCARVPDLRVATVETYWIVIECPTQIIVSERARISSESNHGSGEIFVNLQRQFGLIGSFVLPSGVCQQPGERGYNFGTSKPRLASWALLS